MALIGTFDLDPNRALDIVLDLFSVHIAAHYTFFLALLSFSPWAGAYRIPKDSQEEMATDPDPNRYSGKTLDEVLTLAAGEVPVPQRTGPCLMAQVLGFKFAHYAVRHFQIAITSR
jgi:THO complex subunit 2